MEKLKHLIEEIEHRRKSQESYQFVFAIALGIAVLGGTALLASRLVSTEVATVTPEPAAPSAFDGVALSAKAAIVYDLATGETLYEMNAEAQLPLASLTKLLTLYAAADALGAKSPITMSAKALSTEGESGFRQGDIFTFEDAAKLALVASSNDAAAAIAEAAADVRHAANGTALLANAASSIGLTQTYALNGTGLDENGAISGGYGSARDMALLAAALLRKIPEILKASVAPSVTASSYAGNSYTLKNTNPGVSHIPGLMLSKTGYTDLAGGNLAVVFDAGIGHPVAIVVLGSTRDERFVDVDKLVEATSANFAGLTLPPI